MNDDYDPLAPRPDAITDIAKDTTHEFRALNGRRISITLGLLTVLLFGHFIALYGIDMRALADMRQFGGSIDRVSLMALGVVPWASTVILIETVGLIIAPLRKSIGFVDDHCDPFHWFVILLTLILGAVQAYGISVAMTASGLMAESGWIVTVVLVTSLIAGTLVTIGIAQFINRYGTGHGFWLVFGFSLPFAFPKAIATSFDLARSGSLELMPTLIMQSAMFIAVILIAVVLTRCLFHKGITSPARLVLPVMIGGQLASYVLSLVYYLSNNQLPLAGASFLFIAASCVITTVLLIVYLRTIIEWKVLAFAILALCAYQALPHILAEFGVSNGWYWHTSDGQTLAFVASFTFIVSGVYGRRNTVGNP